MVVDSDAVHAVFGGDGYLHGGGEGEGRGGGDVEGVDGGVAEDELGLGGAEDDPDEKDDEEDEGDEGGDAVEYAAVEPLPLLVVMAAVLGSHFLDRRIPTPEVLRRLPEGSLGRGDPENSS